MPTTNQQTITGGTACASTSGSTCSPTLSLSGIAVKMCASFNVYYLGPAPCTTATAYSLSKLPI